MTTNRPRKNLYIEPEHEELLQATAKEKNISESAVVREILSFYFALHQEPPFRATERFAYLKGKNITTVIIAALSKLIPDRYYE